MKCVLVVGYCQLNASSIIVFLDRPGITVSGQIDRFSTVMTILTVKAWVLSQARNLKLSSEGAFI